MLEDDLKKRSVELYNEYEEYELNLSKYWADPYPNDKNVLGKKEVLRKASGFIDILGFKHLLDWVEKKGVI